MTSQYHSAVNHAAKILKHFSEVGALKYDKQLAISASLRIHGASYDWKHDFENSDKDHDSFQRLKRYCAWLSRKEDPIPFELKSWIADYLEEVFVPPKRPKGAPRTGSGVSMFLGQLVNSVAEGFGLTPTRNDETKEKLSACDAVAEAILTFNKKQETKSKIKSGSYVSLKLKYFSYKAKSVVK